MNSLTATPAPILLLLVLVTGRTGPPVLYSCGMLSKSCSNTRLLLKLLLIYGPVFASSSSSSTSYLSASLSSFQLACSSTSLAATCLRFHPAPFPCSGLLLSQRLIHSTLRYFAGGGTQSAYRQPPRVHIKVSEGHTSMGGGLAEGKK